jgi:hypothetical protein
MLGSSPNVKGNKYFAMMISPVTARQHNIQAKTTRLVSGTQLQLLSQQYVSMYAQHTDEQTTQCFSDKKSVRIAACVGISQALVPCILVYIVLYTLY